MRSRLIYETDLEEQALARLRRPREHRVARWRWTRRRRSSTGRHASRSPADLRARVFELAEALFQSIRMQLSVAALQGDRGRPRRDPRHDRRVLNNRIWLERRFAAIRKLETEADAAQGDRRDRELDQPRARRLLRRPGRPAPPAPPGPGLGL